MHKTDLIGIGELAARTGMAVSAIRFYEARGLIAALRSGGNQRRFLRSDIRRLSFVRIAQQLGLGLKEIQALLARLPQGRTPTRRDWAAIAVQLRRQLDRRIDALIHLRDNLDGCIGCGCLSLQACTLFNPGDRLGKDGAGARRVDPGAR